MFRKLLLLLFVNLGVLPMVFAQQFTLSPEIVYDTTTGVDVYTGSSSGHDFVAMETAFKNVSTDSVYFSWKNITDTTQNPEDWILVGVCDNVFCVPEFGSWYYGATMNSSIPVNPGGGFALIVHIYAPHTSPDTTGIYKIQINTPQQTDTAVFILTKRGGATDIHHLSLAGKKVAVYPNPASDQVTIYADKSLGAANCRVYNMSGGQMLAVDFQNREVVSLNISQFPAGIYFTELFDATGRLITMKKIQKL